MTKLNEADSRYVLNSLLQKGTSRIFQIPQDCKKKTSFVAFLLKLVKKSDFYPFFFFAKDAVHMLVVLLYFKHIKSRPFASPSKMCE